MLAAGAPEFVPGAQSAPEFVPDPAAQQHAPGTNSAFALQMLSGA